MLLILLNVKMHALSILHWCPSFANVVFVAILVVIGVHRWLEKLVSVGPIYGYFPNSGMFSACIMAGHPPIFLLTVFALKTSQ